MSPSDPYLYLTTLFGRHPAPGYIEVRAIPPNGGRPCRTFLPVGHDAVYEAAIPRIVRLAQSHNVYVGVLPRTTRHFGGNTAVERAHCLWADVDSPSVEGEWMYPLPSPNVEVSSGRGMHLYWLLEKPIAIGDDEKRARFRQLLLRLAHALGADEACCDAARILRPPGTINHKRGTPVALRLCDPDRSRLRIAEWETLLPPLPLASRPCLLPLPLQPPKSYTEEQSRRYYLGLAETTFKPDGQRIRWCRSLMWRAGKDGLYDLGFLWTLAEAIGRACLWTNPKRFELAERTHRKFVGG